MQRSRWPSQMATMATGAVCVVTSTMHLKMLTGPPLRHFQMIGSARSALLRKASSPIHFESEAFRFFLFQALALHGIIIWVYSCDAPVFCVKTEACFAERASGLRFSLCKFTAAAKA